MTQSQHHHDTHCQEARKYFSELLEQRPELTPELRHQIQQHMEECPPCERFLQTLKVTISELHGLPCQDTPERLNAALASLAQQAARRKH
jgi:hypothetical protein